MIRTLHRTLNQIQTEWWQNYRYHGGLRAAARCLGGTLRLHTVGTTADRAAGDVDCLTFSVLPRLTTLWAQFMTQALPPGQRMLIGDCSGGLLHLSWPGMSIVPYFNFHHGRKLDVFMREVCRAPYVIVSDDDVFWLDGTPWEWAQAAFERDPATAVVSLFPRQVLSSLLEGQLEQAMGSYCLVIRRDLWLREGLSFRPDFTPREQGAAWFYDTADLAHLHLLERGYTVRIAPDDIRQHLVAFNGVSAWAMRIQKYAGDIQASIANAPANEPKALRVILTLKALSDLLATTGQPEDARHIVPPDLLDRAEVISRSFVGSEQARQIAAQVAQAVERLRAALESRS